MIVRKPLIAASALACAALSASSAFASTAFTTESKDAGPAPSQHAVAREITREQAVDMALKAHPGEVARASKDTRDGKQTWEVTIKGKDGKQWEVYYDIKTGELVAEEGK